MGGFQGFLQGVAEHVQQQHDIRLLAQHQANKELAHVYEKLGEMAEPAFQDQYFQRAFALRTLEPGKKPPKDLTDIAGLVHQQVGTALSAQNQQQAQVEQAQQQQYAQRQQEAAGQVKAGILPRSGPTGGDDESQLSQILGGTPPEPPPGQVPQAPPVPPSPNVQGGGFSATLPTQSVAPGGQGGAVPPGYSPQPGKQFTLKNPLSDMQLAEYQRQQALAASRAAREEATQYAQRFLTRGSDIVNAVNNKTVAETPTTTSVGPDHVLLRNDKAGNPTQEVIAVGPKTLAAKLPEAVKDFVGPNGEALVWDAGKGQYRDLRGNVVLDPVFRGDPSKPLDRTAQEMGLRLKSNPGDTEAKDWLDVYYKGLHSAQEFKQTDAQLLLRGLMAMQAKNQLNGPGTETMGLLQQLVQQGHLDPKGLFEVLGGAKSNVAAKKAGEMANVDIETPAIKKIKEEYELPISDLESLKRQLTPRPGETVLEALQRKNIAKANADLLSASLLRAYGERGATTENDRKVGQATLGAGMLMTLAPETAIKNIDYMIGRMRAKLDEKLAIERGRPAGGPPPAPPTKKNGPPEGPPGNQTTTQPASTPPSNLFKEGEEKILREKSTGRMFKWKLEKGKVVSLGEVKQ